MKYVLFLRGSGGNWLEPNKTNCLEQVKLVKIFESSVDFLTLQQ